MRESSRSARKRRAILDAATEVFLRDGYLGTNMDEIAALSEVSKQTVYKHFVSKEALFIEIVSSMTDGAGDIVRDDVAELDDGGDVAEYLVDYAYRQLTVVLTPRLMQLRRLVIGEVSRFPELAKVLYERGPMRAIAALATAFERLAARGLLAIDDPAGGGFPVQLADHVRPVEPGHAAGRRGDSKTGRAAQPRHRRRAGVPRGLRQEMKARER